MAEKLGVEESARTIMEFCATQLKTLGIQAYVCFAEIDKEIFAIGRTDLKFDIEVLIRILEKNNIRPNIIKAESMDELTDRIKSSLDKAIKGQ